MVGLLLLMASVSTNVFGDGVYGENLASAAQKIASIAPHGFKLHDIAAVPDSNDKTYAVLWVHSGGPEDAEALQYCERAKVALFRGRGGMIKRLGHAVELPVTMGCTSLRLKVESLIGNKLPVVLVNIDYEGASWEPTDLHVLRPSSRGLKSISVMHSSSRFKVLHGKDGRLVIATAPTWKVWWNDCYEWRDGQFRFANWRHPEMYGSPEEYFTDPYVRETPGRYPDYVRAAALAAIKGRFEQAKRYLVSAEYLCRMALKYQDVEGSPGHAYYSDYGFYGDTRVNLKEIDRRLRWLRSKQLSHPLLYRPYDFDLLVAPYKLGHAGDSRE